ncbi:protein SSUH2 homolog [Corticium candelabrum]|uniref:protein SSUH2 homolog n=1 Tax=Corticium candelabrum TaxID=121492 RepID=UPI002E26A9AB|nr:protein SSUH2 homolog [Corticium candelabrum]
MAAAPMMGGQPTNQGYGATSAVDTPTFQGDIPGEDVAENPNAQPSQPTAPSLDQLQAVSGYEAVSFNEGSAIPPPSYAEAVTPQAAPTMNTAVPRVTEEQARAALLDHVSQNCCYGKSAAQDLVFTSIEPSSAFHYTLETFGESRSTSWAMEPYMGQPIDTAMTGPAPGPWDISAEPRTLFNSESRHVEVPHTASIKPCHNCFARGHIRCHHCHGRGRVRCNSCHGSGHKRVHRDGQQHQEHCNWCHGHGRKRCFVCHGHGQIGCPVCSRQGNVKWYIRLTIKWENHKSDHVVERTSLPGHLIAGAQGQLAFRDEQFRVAPVNNFPEPAVNQASQQLVGQHTGNYFNSERVLKQRHQVRIVPVATAHYQWKNSLSQFWVFGFENRVYAPDYPQKCCCGCTIL